MMKWLDQEIGWNRPLLVVGEANPYGNRRLRNGESAALFPHPEASSGARLKRASGLDLKSFMFGVHRINLLDVAAKDGRWSLHDHDLAQRRAEDIVTHESDHEPRVIFLLGRNVARAFNNDIAMDKPLWFTEFYPPWARRVVLFPHPSGRSTVWNNSIVINEVRRQFDVLRPAIEEAAQ